MKYAYEYASKLIGRPIYTHEFYTLEEELKERSREDFIEICKNLTEENKDDKNQRCPVGGLDRTQKVDKISLQNAVETTFWMAVWAAEPGREIEVKMSYDDLKIICDMIDEKRKDRWVPVEEKLPEDGTYLCTFKGELCGIEEPFTGMCGIENGIWDEPDYVTAWKPIPDPYRGNTQKKETIIRKGAMEKWIGKCKEEAGRADMQELEEILEKIKSALKDIYLDIANNYDVSDLRCDSDKVACVAGKFRSESGSRIEDIISKYMYDGWIPVEERLPEKNEYFVDTSSDREFPNGYYRRLEIAYMTDTIGYTHGYYDGYKWMDKRHDIIKNVVAWKIHEPYHPEKK